MSASEPTGLEIAITGMAGRFPGARDVDELWRNLRAGVEGITTFTDEELLAAGEDPARLANPLYVRRGAVLDGIEEFDAAFFGITPREAELMDPQHRLFLQEAWHALESAGCDPDRFDGSIGVYGAASSNTYLIENVLRNERVDAKSLPALFGNQTDYLTTRVSYKLNLRGPSLDVQTSCSSSLVALHLACQALLAGECDLALAGGVSITVPHRRGYLYQEQGIYSPDGHCRAFSSAARGTVGGNGVALVVLRRLEDAERDGDRIRAIVRGSAINNDGSGKVGYTAPSVEGQTEVVRSALAMADVAPDTIAYVETHGTGTSLGDPIEIAALADAFGPDVERGACALGSIKTNIGHLDTAAGITGVIKAALALEHRELPPSLNCDEPDPAIDFPSTPFRVNTALAPWRTRGDVPRRAGVSSFGIGGTNAHVILEEAPEPTATPGAASAGPELVLLSAQSPAALERATDDLAHWLRAEPAPALADVAYTLQVGRKGFPHRRAVVGDDPRALADALAARDAKQVRGRFDESDDRGIAFLFPGQGAQYAGMGRALYEHDPGFREHVDRACELFRPRLGRDLRELLFPAAGREADANAELRQTALTQPALFVVEHALARRLMDQGLAPSALIGHSIGEYVAATLAGVFELAGAIELVGERGRLMQGLPPGAMLAIPLPATEVEPLLGPELALAAVNEPSSCVASGPHEAVRAFAAELAGRGIEGRELQTSHAFHSAMMDPILDEFTALVARIGPRAPEIPFVSNVSGAWIEADEATDPAYWARHLRRTVRFADGVARLLDGGHALLEVGPGTTLTTLSKRVARHRGVDDPVLVASMRHPREDADDRAVLQGALGQLWLARVTIDWPAVHAAAGGTARRRVALPAYPFDERRFWIEPTPVDARGRRGAAGKLADVSDWFWVPSWKRTGARPAPAAPTAATGALLVFADTDELSARLADGADGRVTTVVPGAGFEALGARRFAVRPGSADDLGALVDALAARGPLPDAIVHAWCLEPPAAPAVELDRGLHTLLFLGQAIARRSAADPIRVLVLARNLQSVLGTEDVSPERAALSGACRALNQEVPHLTCRSVDVDVGAGPADERLVERLRAELTAPGDDDAIAYRGRHRWALGYEPLAVDAEPDADAVPAPLRERGHYLVIGGLGSIGLEVAGVLGRAARARLVLTSRRDFPAPETRDAWVAAHPPDDETSRRIAELEELEEAGAEVLVVRADATDPDAMRAALAAGVDRFGPLRGVVFAAGGEKRMTLFGDTTAADCAEQNEPKLAGLAVLEEVLADHDPDFCLVQSSLSSVLGALAMVGYVAAHHAVDAFVQRHNTRVADGGGTPWISANWDNWLSWKEPEFAHEDGGDAFFMTPAEGADALRRVLGLPAGSQVVVSTGDLERRRAAWLQRESGDERDASAELYERPELQSDYVAPESPAEKALAGAWSDVLGIGRIGVHDSFFELGGDSVLGLQAVAKLAQSGFRITPAQIFEHPTIAELARAATTEASAAEQDLVQGVVPLVPIQRWFFELGLANPSHFGMPTVLAVPAGVATDVVAAALLDVTRHHDALRLRFEFQGDAIEQAHADAVDAPRIVDVDLSAVLESERVERMRERANELHRGLDLATGPVQAAALFRFGPDEPARLVWIVHHLVVDAVSWRTLAEDFATALDARRAGQDVALPPKTTSFRQFACALEEDARSARTLAELEHWTSAEPATPLPVDRSSGDPSDRCGRFGSERSVTRSLDEDRTKAFLVEVPKAYGTRADEVLVTALVRGLADWTGSDALWLDLEGHGRDGLDDQLDLSRTVGWFTTLYPAHVSLAGATDPGAALKAVKERLRSIPRHGLGWGQLRYLGDDPEVRARLAAQPRPELNFLYLGRVDAGTESPTAQLMQAAGGDPCGPDAPRSHLVVVVAHVSAGRLQVQWDYSADRHERATIERLADAFVAELTSLIDHCRGRDRREHTPSDFQAARVKQADLDKLLAKIGKTAPRSREDESAS